MWNEHPGTLAFLTIGYGKRIYLGHVDKIPVAEYWATPEKSCVLYQEFGGREKIKTLCYSNLYPEECRPSVEAALNEALEKLELLSHRSYERGMAPPSGEDLPGLAASMGAEYAGRLEDMRAELNAIHELPPAARGKVRRAKRALMQKIQREAEAASAEDMLRKGFNRKTAAATIEITGEGTFDALNKEGLVITPLLNAVSRLERG